MTGRMFRNFLVANIRLIKDVAEDIKAAGSLGDRRFVQYGFAILGDAIDDGTNLVRGFYEGRFKRKAMGAAEEKGKHWQQGSPAEIIENMRLITSHYLAIIKALQEASSEMDESQARDFDRRRIQNLREMALRIQTGKTSIMAKDPSFWTPALEEEFREALEYRLGE